MRVLTLAAAMAVAGALSSAATASGVEPRLHVALAAPDPSARIVALTFDACSGTVDRRILDLLVAERVRATIFVTHRWLNRNAEALAVLTAHPDLFEIENHGDHHVPAVTDAATVFGLRTAGSLDAVRREVDGGAAAILTATGAKPRWFRGATARYSRDAMADVERGGLRIAGFSLNADMGAALPAAQVARRMAAAKSGDVVIAHINQPGRSAGAGVAEGVRALKAAGFRFVRLDEAVATAD